MLRQAVLTAGCKRVASLSDLLGDSQLGGPARACFEQRFKIRHTLVLRILDFVVGVERSGIRRDVQVVRTVEVSSAQRDGRSVFDL